MPSINDDALDRFLAHLDRAIRQCQLPYLDDRVAIRDAADRNPHVVDVQWDYRGTRPKFRTRLLRTMRRMIIWRFGVSVR